MQACLVLFALAAAPVLQAQTCESIPHPGTESISAHITIKDTTIEVTDGMVLPAWTTLQIDSVATANGSCTGMAWANTSEPSCEPTGYVWNRVPNHTYVWVDIGALNGSYAVGNVWGLYADMNVLDTQSPDTTGPNYLWLYFQGSYTRHEQRPESGDPG